MKKSIPIILLAFIFCSCEQPTQFERNNSNDPLSSTFEPDSLEDFKLSILENHILLEWKTGSKFIEGYLISKTDNTGSFNELITINKEDSLYKDKSPSPFSGTYSVQYINSSNSNNNLALLATYDINPTNFSLSEVQNDGLYLKWNNKAYFETEVLLEWKSNSNSYKPLTTIRSSLERYRLTKFDQEAIGINRFRLTEYSELDTTEPLVTSQIRLPVWEHPGNINIGNSAYRAKLGDSIYGFIAQGRNNLGYKSHRINIFDFSVQTIQSPQKKITSLSLIGDKFIAISYPNYYQIYDSKSDNWSLLSSESQLDNRIGQSAIALNDSLLLVSGGARDGANGEVLTSSLIYNLKNHTWREIDNLNISRFGHFSVKLDNGNIFVAGSKTLRHIRGSAEIYNPNTDKWNLLETPPITPYSIVKLKSGKVLAVGENGSIEFNPSNSEWENTASYELGDHITKSISWPILYNLPDGNAILAGMVKKGIENTVFEGVHSQIYIAEKSKWIKIDDLKYYTAYLDFPFVTRDGDFVIIHRARDSEVPYEILEYSKFR